MTPATASGPLPPAGEQFVHRPARPWVPIRSLTARHRQRILRHLLALPERDRYLRFGYPATDAHVERYVQGLDFDRDEVFGIFNWKLELIAVAHVAFPPPAATPAADLPGMPGADAVEFGGSVNSTARGRGYGARLFEHAMLHARNRGFDTLFIHALSENTAMLRIARQAGGVVHRSGSESDAYVRLPPETLASRIEQWVGDGAAQLDYRLKREARRVDALIDAIGEIKSGIGERTGRAGGN